MPILKNICLALAFFLSSVVMVSYAQDAAGDAASDRQSSLQEALNATQDQGVLSQETIAEDSFSEEKNSAQEEQPVEQAPPAAKTVTAIEVTGNKAISSNVVVSKMKTRPGSPYQENVISDDLKRLYLLGYFSDIKIDNEEYKDGVKVIVRVVERPVIEKVTFSGARRVYLRQIKKGTVAYYGIGSGENELLQTRDGQYVDYPKLDEDVRAIKKWYEKKGFTQVGVAYKVSPPDAAGKVAISFQVDEGGRIRIKQVIIKGNTAFSDARILKLLKTKRAWLFNAGVLKEEEFQEDASRIESFYQNNGYSDVQVDSETIPDARHDGWLLITFKVQEGKKYLVGTLMISGNENFTQKAVLSKLTECTPGKVFSQDGMKKDVLSIQGLYTDRGYISVQIQESTAVNASTGRVDITYSIVENQVTYVDKIKIRGNVKTRDVVIRRELRIKPGERFDGEKLRRSRERLQNLGFFDEKEGIAFDTEETGAPEKKDLVVAVKEINTGSFSFGGGYSTVDKLVGFAELEQKNFDWKNFPYFTGAGQDLKLRASIGSVSQGFDLSFTEPWLFDYPVSFGFDAYKRVHKRESDVGYGYDQDVTGGDLRLGNSITEFWKQGLTYRLDVIKISNISENATADLMKEAGSNTISSLEYSLTFDSRNNVFAPTRGNLIANSFEAAGGPLAGDKDFGKYRGRFSHYFPLFRNSALEARVTVGLAKAYGNSESVPIYERFFAGGSGTVRGYNERKIGPVDQVTKDPLGGESMLIGNLEYTYPLLSFLKLAAFYDVGNVWDKMGDIGQTKDTFTNTGKLKSGMGFGVRIKTPIGPLVLDYGIPLDKEPGETDKGSGKFHFSTGYGF